MDRTSWYGDSFYVDGFGQVTLKWPPRYKQDHPEARVYFETNLIDADALTLVRRALSAHKRVMKDTSSFKQMSFSVSTVDVEQEDRSNFVRGVVSDVMASIQDAAKRMSYLHEPSAKIFALSHRRR